MRQAGFTLIEVMVAMAITAVVAVMAYYGIDSAIRISRSAEQAADELRQMNRAFDVMARDFRQIIGRTVRDPSGFGKQDAFFLDENATPMLRFSRNGWTNPEPARFQRSQLQRVEYQYDGEKLTRTSWQMMDRYDDSKAQDIVLLDNVTAFSVRVMQQPDISQLNQLGSNVFINLKSSARDQWEERWPPLTDTVQEASSALPMAVEMIITLKGWGEIRRIFELVDSAGESL